MIKTPPLSFTNLSDLEILYEDFIIEHLGKSIQKVYKNKIVINLKGQIDFFPILYLNFGLFNAMAGIAFSIRTILVNLIYGSYSLMS